MVEVDLLRVVIVGCVACFSFFVAGMFVGDRLGFYRGWSHAARSIMRRDFERGT